MDRKGIELPVNAIIIIVLALVVLAAIAAVFVGGVSPGGKTAKTQGSFGELCTKFAACGGCNTPPGCTEPTWPTDSGGYVQCCGGPKPT